MLCGGIGSRLDQNMCPKPMTMIAGIPLYQRVISELTVDNLTIVINQYLLKFNFIDLVKKYIEIINSDISVKFFVLPYDTRGPLESLFCYLRSDNSNSVRHIAVLDNDNIYMNLDVLSTRRDGDNNGLLCCKTSNDLSHYSFVEVEGERVIAIHEKNRKSDMICVGYTLTIDDDMMKIISYLIDNVAYCELFMSRLYERLLSMKYNIKYSVVDVITLGTKQDIISADEALVRQDKRLNPIAVFDIDNTIICVKNNNASDSRKIENICSLISRLKKRGWKIILHTARGMKNGDLSDEKKKEVIAAVAGIEYDEIVFMKPYGDVYIDDKAFNPYDNDFYHKLGIYTNHFIKRCIIRESYKSITKYCSNVDGEVNYYNTIHSTSLSHYFPKMLMYDTDFIKLEFIQGPTFSQLFLERLLTPQLFIRLLDVMDDLHRHEAVDSVGITEDDVMKFYYEKIDERYMLLSSVAVSVDNKDIVDKVAEEVELYYSYLREAYEIIRKKLSLVKPIIANVIHGDLWFRNIIATSGDIRLIDIRGKIGNTLTLKGDKLYDYAKIYQSISGMDRVLEESVRSTTRTFIDDNIISNKEQLEEIFINRYKKYIDEIKIMSLYTMFCSLTSWDNIETHSSESSYSDRTSYSDVPSYVNKLYLSPRMKLLLHIIILLNNFYK